MIRIKEEKKETRGDGILPRLAVLLVALTFLQLLLRGESSAFHVNAALTSPHAQAVVEDAEDLNGHVGSGDDAEAAAGSVFAEPSASATRMTQWKIIRRGKNKNSPKKKSSEKRVNKEGANKKSANWKGIKTRNTKKKSKIRDVVVVGAGWSGLSTARTLLSKGVRDVVVLEARNRIGGRCSTKSLGKGKSKVNVELGCGFIHQSSRQNPAYRIVQNLGFKVTPAPATRYGYYSDNYGGKKFPHKINTSKFDQFVERQFYPKGFYPFQAFLQNTTLRPISLRAAANRYIESANLKGDALRGFEYALDTYVEQEFAANARDMSLWWWDTTEIYPGGDTIVNDGMSAFVERYAKKIGRERLRLGAVVKKVDYRGGDRVVVTYEKKGDNRSRQIVARQAVVTVPLGVLKAGTIKFVPRLSEKKRNAIRDLGMGNYGKVVLRFADNAKVPWPAEEEYILRIADPKGNDNDMQGEFTIIYNLQPATGKKVLLALTAGWQADRTEKLSNREARDRAIASLEKMFGAGRVPQPIEVAVSRWRSDRFARGSYSYYKVGSRPGNRRNLFKPEGRTGQLRFAGEACSWTHPSTIHGAIEIGMSVGLDIAKTIKAKARSPNIRNKTTSTFRNKREGESR